MSEILVQGLDGAPTRYAFVRDAPLVARVRRQTTGTHCRTVYLLPATVVDRNGDEQPGPDLRTDLATTTGRTGYAAPTPARRPAVGARAFRLCAEADCTPPR